MSDSEDSTVTYMEVSSPFEDLSDIGSLGVDGLPMMPHDPYAYVEAALQASPSPDYVLKDDVLPAEEQPMPVVVSPTADSPGYILEYDPEEDDEDPEEDPADYLTDRDDEEEDEESSGDEADDKDEDKDEGEEEKHPALADSIPPPPVHRTTAKISIPIQAPTPFCSKAEIDRLLAIPSPPPSPLSPLVDDLEVTLSPRKRLCIALGLRFKVGESSSAPTARPTRGFRADYGFLSLWMMILGETQRERQDTNEIYGRLDDAQDDRLLMGGQLNMLRRDRRAYARIARLIESKARLSREAWVQSIDASDTARAEKMAPKRTTISTPATTTTTNTLVTNAQLKVLIDQGISNALAALDANRSMNGDDSHNSRTCVRDKLLLLWFERMEIEFHISNYTVENQVKFTTCTLLGSALTWWNSYVKTTGPDVTYAMNWTNLKKKMTDKYYPRGEIKKLEVKFGNLKLKESDKIERYIGGLPDMIHGSVMTSKPKTMQDVIEFTTELIDKKISTFTERQAENKRKFEDTSKNN
nr:hypothetical protein [Tanacetum cinerariifolium]